MKYIILLLFMNITLCLSGQTIKHDTVDNKMLLGVYPNFSYFDRLIDDTEKATLFTLELRPYLAYNVYKNLYLGGSFSYEFISSNFYNKDNFMELGVFFRYVLPYTIDIKFLRRFHLYSGVEFYKTNYRIVSEVVNEVEYKSLKIEEDFIISDQLSESKISIPIGFKFHAFNNFYIDFNWQYVHFINGTNINGFMCGIGYNIGQRKWK